MDATFSPVRDPGHAVSNLVAVLRDVTKEVELERQLRQAQKMDALGVLAAGIAHDFNNVLTTILASAELIKCRIPADSPILPKVDAILHAGLCAAGLTTADPRLQPQGRREARAPGPHRHRAGRPAHPCTSSIPANIELRDDLMSGVWVEADPALIHQVVLNLAINALQAMQPAGGVLQVALTEEVEETRGMPPVSSAVLMVRDTGCGMDAQVQERIFEPFFTTKPAGEGTGLGLAMVHATVAKAGGRISVQSAPGQGSTFQVRLPVATGRVRPAREALPLDVGGTESILFVDDDRMTAAVARLGLQKLGYQVASFTRPEEALALFQRHPDAYDLVFLDLSMPGLNGLDLAQKIQELRPGLPMILVTGMEAANDLVASSRANFADIVIKPFTAIDLASALRKALLTRPQAASAKPVAAGAKPLILLAEDSLTTRSMIRSGLERAGYDVQEARDGLEAWELFTHAPSSRRFDLLLTDVVMPRMDGLELIQLVRKADPALPIGVMTSNEDKETVKAALKLGVNEFLNKPFERAELTECVKKLLAVRSTRLDARRSLETARAVRQAQQIHGGGARAGPAAIYPATNRSATPAATCSAASPAPTAPSCSSWPTWQGTPCSVPTRWPPSWACSRPMWGSASASWSRPPAATPRRRPCPAACTAAAGSATRPCDPLPHLASKLNHGIHGGPFSEVPVCTLLGLWTPATGRLQLLNAGHPPWPALAGAGRATPGRCGSTAPRWASSRKRTWKGPLLQLEPGDRFLFGTDGFFEVQSPARRAFQDLAPGQWQAAGGLPAGLGPERDLPGGPGPRRRRDRRRPAGGGLRAARLERAHGGVGAAAALDLHGHRPGLRPASTQCLQASCRALERPRNDRRFDIVLAVREALTNAVFHGNGNRPGTSVSLRCRPDPDTAGAWWSRWPTRARVRPGCPAAPGGPAFRARPRHPPDPPPRPGSRDDRQHHDHDLPAGGDRP